MTFEWPSKFAWPVAVIDTNILLDGTTCFDLMEAYERRPDLDPVGREATWRRQRAREALLLFVHLDGIKATTYSIFEYIRKAKELIPPEPDDTFECHAMKLWVNYVREQTLPDWIDAGPSDGTDEPVGNAADALLVERAKFFGVPLISHEGFGPTGLNLDGGIRKKAAAAGVTVMLARDFYAGANELLLAALFMTRFQRGAEKYLRASTQPPFVRDSLLYMQGYYRHIFYGLTEGYTEPLPVRLSDLDTDSSAA